LIAALAAGAALWRAAPLYATPLAPAARASADFDVVSARSRASHYMPPPLIDADHFATAPPLPRFIFITIISLLSTR